MRRILILMGTLGLALQLALPAGANPPTEETFDITSVDCSFSNDVSGFVFVAADTFGTFAGANVWLDGEPFQGDPDLIGDFENTTASITDGNVTATVPLLDFGTLEPAGMVISLTATITGPVGDPQTFSDRFRDGNRWVEITSTFQALEIVGVSLALDGETLTPECFASQTHEIFRSTNPDAYRIAFDGAFVDCLVPSDGSTLFLAAGAFDGGSFLDMAVFPPGTEPFEEPPSLVGFAELGPLVGSHDVMVDLFDPLDPEGAVMGAAQVTMTVTEGDTISSRIVFQNGRIKEVTTELLTAGSVEVSQDTTDTTYMLEGCFGQAFEDRGIFTSPNGPKPSGVPPPNDAPSGAVPLPGKLVTSTRATALEPEVPWIEEFDGEVFEFPFGHTLWYTVVGTGGEVTIDTAGSNFDTVIAVYADGAFEQAALVDDVFEEAFSLQAAITFLAEGGTTYYIQIGGFAGEFGQLKLRSNGAGAGAVSMAAGSPVRVPRR